MINPWIILAIVVAFVGVGTGAYIKGGTDAVNRVEAQAAREERIGQIAYEAGLRGTAAVVAQIEVKHTTIQQKAKETIRENVIYRDCVADPVVERMLDDARANRSPSVASGHSELPGGTAADLPQ